MNARVLVVDDEPMITHNLQAFLEIDMGHLASTIRTLIAR
jgi:YesN/AraC family two-component response regulator